MQYLPEGAVISIVYWVSTYLTFNNDYVSTLDSSSCGANTETFITLQPSSVYYKLRDTQINLYKQKLDVTPPRMTFCPSLWQTEPTSEKTHRERERTNKRCARTLAKTQTTAVKPKGLRGLNLAERPQRQSLSRCTVSSVWHRLCMNAALSASRVDRLSKQLLRSSALSPEQTSFASTARKFGLVTSGRRLGSRKENTNKEQ